MYSLVAIPFLIVSGSIDDDNCFRVSGYPGKKKLITRPVPARVPGEYPGTSGYFRVTRPVQGSSFVGPCGSLVIVKVSVSQLGSSELRIFKLLGHLYTYSSVQSVHFCTKKFFSENRPHTMTKNKATNIFVIPIVP